LDDAIEGSVTRLSGQHPIELGILLEGVAVRERGVALGREPPFAASV
jgi:hypothetical protein